MKIFFSAILFLLSSQISFGQFDSLEIASSNDSADFRASLRQQKVSFKADSLTNTIKNFGRTNVLTDTVSIINNSLDSIQNSLNTRIDSITNSYSSFLTKIQSSAQVYQAKIDSLQSRKLPTDKYKAKMDSLSQRFTSVQQDVSEKIEGIKTKARKKVKSIKYPPELEDKVAKLTGSIENFSPKTIEAKLLSGLDFDKLNALKNRLSAGSLENVTSTNVPELPKVKGLSQQGIPDLKGSIPEIKGMDQVSNVSGDAMAVQGKIDEATKDLNPNSIDNLAESKASQFKEVKVLQEQTADLPLNHAASEEEMKTKLKEQAQKVAVDHFADKEKQLKAAMNKISKYKKKYPSVKSIADLVKRPPNPMRNKPLIERIVPGVGFQIQKKGEDFMVDFNPYIGYRFTGRTTAGPGWSQRVAYNFDYRTFTTSARIFGPRLFSEFKLGKGFSPRLEVEVMNTKIPPSTITSTIDPLHREWVWGAFVGIKKEYKFIKSVKGTASVMTRVFNPDRKSPYADVLNVRFGFEFQMKKKINIKK